MKPFHRFGLFRHLLGALACAAAFSAPASAQSSYTVGATSTGVPFTFLDIKTNKLQGMMVDTVTAVGSKAGFSVNIQQTPFAALIPSLTGSKIDIIAAAMLKTEARAQIVDFSDPVYSYGEGLFVNAQDQKSYKTLDDLKGEIVGAQVGTVFVDALNKKGGFKEVKTYDSVSDMMRDVGLGRIKAGFGDRPIVAYQLSQGANPQVRLVKEYQSTLMGDVCLVVRKGDAKLMERLNKAIAELKADGTLARIVEQWKLN
ncbi:ABC transporter substrate-binding protein [Herbaspirillum robiniae]|uniref:Amino acid ABC transporter substrate-binding protein n=1 Tax=Herbaspirillum robiniae TaxID=2014887 RepID=A0A246WRT5_9BURK|nr:ABC transporter substrate-binding protein [Herbaspirillum robiniae]NUU03978.1 amino acid ABC transporter substrate-binding protein [Herbaspirillum robiniae]OWY29107.1 amino acid ABC transporter substrate-binding protein [Herbaspirillum robiniae]